MLLNGDYVTYR